ncbi:MAG: L-lactate permease [Anaerolineae bacterium]|jgi:lactate permease
MIDWLLAASPILLVLFLMLALHWKGSQAGPAALVAALLIAHLRFGAGGQVLAWALLKGLLLALWVLYIVWAAILFYRLTAEAGAVSTIGRSLSRLSENSMLQALLLGWAFTTFLTGVGGFGVPVAVVAPLLVAIGFTPVAAVVITSVGSAWSVTYGTLASAFYALIAATGYPGEQLALPAAIGMGVACFLCGAGALWAAGGPGALRQSWPALLIMGLAMSGTQILLVIAGLWTIGVLCSGLAGLGAGVLVARWQTRRNPAPAAPSESGGLPLLWALLPYGLFVALVFVVEFVPSIKTFLDQIVISVRAPELVTSRGWTTPAGTARTINLFGHPGALLLYGCLLTYILYRLKGFYKPGAARRIGQGLISQSTGPTIGIATMMGMAITMQHAGMTQLLAEGLNRVAGPAFPFLSIFIGALGAFMTGSSANSSVIFGVLQEQTALLVGMSATLALTAQALGGALGGIFAPTKVILGCATVKADESVALRKTLAYGLAILAIMALLIWVVDLVT